MVLFLDTQLYRATSSDSLVSIPSVALPGPTFTATICLISCLTMTAFSSSVRRFKAVSEAMSLSDRDNT